MSAIDFSYARPGGLAVTTVGVTSVGRYLATDDRGITLEELNDYSANGVTVWLIKENSSRGMLNGYGQGHADALDAQAQLNTLGYPNAAVYYTADFDIQPSQFPAGDSYLQGVASVMPVTRIGLYAGNDYLNHAADLVTYRWKTASSSFDHGQTANVPIHLVQTTDTPPIPNTDYDLIMAADHGQINGTETAGTGQTPLKPEIRMENEMILLRIPFNNDGTPNGQIALVGETTFKQISKYTADGFATTLGPIHDVTQDTWTFWNQTAAATGTNRTTN